MAMETRQLVPLITVADVERSVSFYKHLGFEIGNTFAPQGATKPAWAWLRSGNAQLMLGAATEPAKPEQQTVLFYLYTDDVGAARTSLIQAGFNPGQINTPFYAPRGEFELRDPDGYRLMITHT